MAPNDLVRSDEMGSLRATPQAVESGDSRSSKRVQTVQTTLESRNNDGNTIFYQEHRPISSNQRHSSGISWYICSPQLLWLLCIFSLLPRHCSASIKRASNQVPGEQGFLKWRHLRGRRASQVCLVPSLKVSGVFEVTCDQQTAGGPGRGGGGVWAGTQMATIWNLGTLKEGIFCIPY